MSNDLIGQVDLFLQFRIRNFVQLKVMNIQYNGK